MPPHEGADAPIRDEKAVTTSADAMDSAPPDSDGSRVGLDRRSVLKLTGVAATGLGASGLMGGARAATTSHGISFDRVVDAVDDLGMDPTGGQTIDSALDSAIETGTLIEFPPGTYLFAAQHLNSGVERFGIRGTGSSHRDVQFVPTAGSKLKFIHGGGPGPYLIENVSFQERDDDSTQLSLGLGSSEGVFVSNVEWLGQTPSDNGGVDYSINADVYNEGAVAVYENVVAGIDQPALPVEYPDGVAFIRAGPAHKGEIVLRNPILHERNSAATRCTNHTGVLTVEGGEFVNNQNANLRFGAGDHPSKVSSATGTYVEVDGSRNSADAVRLDSSSNGYAGAILQDLEIVWTRDSGRGVIALPGWAGHGRAEFYNCVIRNDGAGVQTVNADAVTDTTDDAIIIENCAFTGTGGGIDVDDRPDSVIRDSCFDMPNGTISGMAQENVSTSGCREPGSDETSNEAPGASISVASTDDLTVTLDGSGSTDSDGTIARYEWDVDGEVLTGETVSYTFPDYGTYPVGLTVEDDDGATASATTEVTVTDANELEIRGTGVSTNYAFEVSEWLEPDESTIEDWDEVSATSANGWVTATSDVDRYTFQAEITSFEFLEGEADVYVNGELVDPTADPSNDLEIRGIGESANYAVEVSESLEPVDGTIEDWDEVTATSANGWVTETTDSDEYTFQGEITSFEFLEGDADVYVNGELTELGGPQTRDLKIQGGGRRAKYDFAVSEAVTPVEETIEKWDDVSATGAVGWVTDTSDVDRYTVEGEFTHFRFKVGEADVYLDGDLVDHTTL